MVAWFEENDSLPTNGVIVWSQNATPYLDRIIAIIAHGRWGVMAIDDTPLPEDLAKLEAFEKTTAADLMWQWRVKMLGVPADLVERPYRPKPSRPLN
ncbi:MAG TPA: hypothetical protein VG983_09600 [Caulobacterales bacterium]|nr:hypothetical protein [Caulobacterales bacterium]